MNEVVNELADLYERYFRKAALVAPETLKKEHPDASIWFVTTEDITQAVGKQQNWTPEYLNEIAEYIINRLHAAVSKGFGIIVVDEPSVTGSEKFMGDLATQLKNAGLHVTKSRVTRHRYCPHQNGGPLTKEDEGIECYYYDDMDGGAGEITNLQITAHVPLL